MLGGIARRVGRRLLASIPALFGVVVVTFILMRVLPGDPAVFFASGPSAGQAEIEELRRTHGARQADPGAARPLSGRDRAAAISAAR